MIKVALVRGKYLNNFEGQNYIFKDEEIELVGISSLRPIHTNFEFPVIKLPSFADITGMGRAVKIISNRAFGDSQVLFGLGKYASQFDIFHTADPHYYYSYQLAKLRSENKIKKLIVTSWETIPFNNESVPQKKKIKRFVQKHADLFLCYTERAKECLVKEGVDSSKIEVIKLGVDIQKFQYPISNIPFDNAQGKQSPKTNKKFPNETQILFVGRLVEEKGILDLYEAFRNLKFKISNFKFVKLTIIGDGPLNNHLQSKIKQDKLDRFVTIVQKRYEEMSKVYHEADMFILPSKRTKTWEEQYGMVLIEAMASGLPIIAYDTGVIKEVVGNAGIYIHEGDVNGLAFAIRKLTQDKTFARKLGTMGRVRAEKEYDCRITAKKIIKLYKKLYSEAK